MSNTVKSPEWSYRGCDNNRIDRLESIQDTAKATGENVYFDNAKNYPMMSLKGEGKSEQVTTTGKNLYNKDTDEVGKVYSAEGVLGVAATWTTSDWILVEPSTEYYIHLNSTGSTNFLISEFDENKTFIQRSTTRNLITSETTKYIRFSFKNDLGMYDIQITKGTTDTVYEPYTGNQPAPNPDYPQEIKTISEASYRGVGKQFFIMPDSVTKGGITYTLNDDGTFNVSGTSTSTIELRFYSDKLLDNGVYTISTNVNNTNLKFTVEAFQTENKWISLLIGTNSTNVTLNTKEIVIPQNTNLIRYAIKIESGATLNISNGYIQLEKGTEATPYELYQENTLPIDLKGNELASVGTVSDKLLIDRKGNVAIKKNVGKVVLNGSESITKGGEVKRYYIVTSNLKLNISNKNIPNILCNKLLTGSLDDTANNINCITSHSSSERFVIYLDICSEFSVSEFKSWLQENNVTVYYELATPQLISLGTITNPEIFKGVNNIVVETNLGNMNVEVEYIEDLQLRIEKIEQAIISLGGI